MYRKPQSSAWPISIILLLNSSVLWAAPPVSKHYFALVDDHSEKGAGSDPEDFEDYEIVDVAIPKNYNSVLKITAKHNAKVKVFSVLFESPKDSALVEHFLTHFSSSFDMQVTKSDYIKLRGQKSSKSLPNLIPSHFVKFLAAYEGKLLPLEKPLKKIDGEYGPQARSNIDSTDQETSKNFLKTLGKSLGSFTKKLFHFSKNKIESTTSHSLETSLDTVEMLEEPLRVFRKSVEEVLLAYDSNHMSVSYLTYLKQNKDDLQKNKEFLAQVRAYLVAGTHYSHQRGAMDCPQIKVDSGQSDHEVLQNVIGFAACFTNKSDAEILLGTWGQVNVDRGQFNSYVDMVTSPYTSYTYIKNLPHLYPDKGNLKSRIIAEISSSIGLLNRFSGAWSLLESRRKSVEFSSLYLLDILIMIPEVSKNFKMSVDALQELRNLKEIQPEVSAKLEKLQLSMGMLAKFLNRAGKQICADPVVRNDLIDAVPHACDNLNL